MSSLTRTITILFGGRSTEHDASIHSFHAIRDEIILSNQEHMVSNVIYISRDLKVYKHNSISVSDYDINNNANQIGLKELIEIFQQNNSFVLSLLHGNEGEDGCFQGIAELTGVNGSFGNVFSASTTMSKWASQIIASHVTNELVCSPKTLMVREDNIDQLDLADFGDTIIVKPNSLGASLFTSKLKNFSLSEVKKAIYEILIYDSTALVQEYIDGREFTFGIFKNNDKIVTLPLVEAITVNGFLGFENKHKKGMVGSKIISENEDIYQLIKKTSIKLFNAFEVSAMARFDYILRRNDSKLFFLETNTIPGLGKNSIFPKLLKESNLDRIDLINAVMTNNKRKSVIKTYKYSIET